MLPDNGRKGFGSQVVVLELSDDCLLVVFGVWHGCVCLLLRLIRNLCKGLICVSDIYHIALFGCNSVREYFACLIQLCFSSVVTRRIVPYE